MFHQAKWEAIPSQLLKFWPSTAAHPKVILLYLTLKHPFFPTTLIISFQTQPSPHQSPSTTFKGRIELREDISCRDAQTTGVTTDLHRPQGHQQNQNLLAFMGFNLRSNWVFVACPKLQKSIPKLVEFLLMGLCFPCFFFKQTIKKMVVFLPASPGLGESHKKTVGSFSRSRGLQRSGVSRNTKKKSKTQYSLVVERTHLKNMLLKLDHFLK